MNYQFMLMQNEGAREISQEPSILNFKFPERYESSKSVKLG